MHTQFNGEQQSYALSEAVDRSTLTVTLYMLLQVSQFLYRRKYQSMTACSDN